MEALNKKWAGKKIWSGKWWPVEGGTVVEPELVGVIDEFVYIKAKKPSAIYRFKCVYEPAGKCTKKQAFIPFPMEARSFEDAVRYVDMVMGRVAYHDVDGLCLASSGCAYPYVLVSRVTGPDTAEELRDLLKSEVTKRYEEQLKFARQNLAELEKNMPIRTNIKLKEDK